MTHWLGGARMIFTIGAIVVACMEVGRDHPALVVVPLVAAGVVMVLTAVIEN